MGPLKQRYLYFVWTPFAVPELVKIGIATDVRARFACLQSGSPVDLDLLAWKPGTAADERAEHARWAKYRERGEWFRLEGELRTYVQHLAEQCE